MQNEPMTFDYKNARGEISRVQLVGWKEQGAYLTGKNMFDGKVKTYRIDRVVSYLEGAEAKLVKPIQQPPPRPKRDSLERQKPEICFTGFDEVTRNHLSESASLAGLRAVKSVTKNLTFLVCGPNAGPVKITKAREAGIYLLSREQAFALFETGELPDSQIPISSDRGFSEIVEDPSKVFAHWAYDIKPYHWPMLGLVQATRIVNGIEVLAWTYQDGGYDFHEGDILYRGNEFLLIIYVEGTGYVEVMNGVLHHETRRAFRIQEEQLAFWLETGIQPNDITELFKGTSQAGLIAWQIST